MRCLLKTRFDTKRRVILASTGMFWRAQAILTRPDPARLGSFTILKIESHDLQAGNISLLRDSGITRKRKTFWRHV